MKPLIACLLIFLTISLLAVAQQMPGGATVQGRVIYEDTGLPLRRTWVGLSLIKQLHLPAASNSNTNLAANTVSYNSASNYSSYETAYVLTGENGEYKIKDVLPGVYFPHIKQLGIRNASPSDINNPNFQQITVIGTDTIDLDIPVKVGGSIEGKVTFADGAPALGLKVRIKRENADSYLDPVAVTDDRGVYRFSGLEEGNYLVSTSNRVSHGRGDKTPHSYVNEADSTLLRVYYPNVMKESDASMVSVRLNTESADTDISLPDISVFSVSGAVVRKSDRKPLAALLLTFEKSGLGEPWNQVSTQRTFTAKDGTWELHDLIPGKYKIGVSRSYNFSGESKDEERLASTEIELEVTDGDLENIILEVPVAATVRGAVKDGGKSAGDYVFVYLYGDVFSSGVVRAGEGSSGSFEIDDVGPGKYRFEIYSSLGHYLKKVTRAGKDITDKDIEIETGEVIENIEIELGTDVGIVKGRVTNLFIPRNSSIHLLPVVDADRPNGQRFQGRRSVEVNALGEFEEGVRPGKYYLIVREHEAIDAGTSDERIQEIIEDWIEGARTIEVKAGETVEVQVELEN